MNKRETLGIHLSLFLIIAVVAGFSGCAGTQVQNKESLLSEAGFHIGPRPHRSNWPCTTK